MGIQMKSNSAAMTESGVTQRPPAKAEKTQFVQSIIRALNVMKVLGDAEKGLSLTEVAAAVGLTPSTAHRLLTTLQQECYVRFDPSTRLWSIGVQAFITGNAFLKTRDFVELARRRMRQLMEESGETVNLAIEKNGEAVYLAQVECRQMMRALASPGARVSMHCSAVGKALLSALPSQQATAMIKRQGLPRVTNATLCTPEALQADLARIRTRGYAVDDGEHAVGLRCVAAVIFDETGSAAGALSLSGPTARVTHDRLVVLGEMVMRAANAITADFGGQVPASHPALIPAGKAAL